MTKEYHINLFKMERFQQSFHCKPRKFFFFLVQLKHQSIFFFIVGVWLCHISLSNEFQGFNQPGWTEFFPWNHLSICAEGMWAPAPYVLQTCAVFVLVEVVQLPEAQQVVKVVQQAAGVFLIVLLLPQGVEIEGQFSLSSGQQQDHQTGI